MENKEHTTEKVGYRDILRQREYLKIILAGLINRFGDSIDAIAFTWLVYAITGNAAWSALVYAANQLPSVLVQSFAGALVEGMDKKKLTILITFVIGMSCSMLVAALNVQFMKTVQQEYLARVGSIFNAGASAATPAASLAVSALAAFCSVSQIFLCSGAICVIIFLVLSLVRVRLE